MENDVIEFFMPMIPPTATAQEKKAAVKNGRIIYYDPPAVKETKQKLTAHLAQHKPGRPFDGALRLITKWLFPITGKHKKGEFKTTRPDTDNLQKALKDCMTKCGFWKDDAQVASEIAEKFYSDLPGIYIRLERLQNDA